MVDTSALDRARRHGGWLIEALCQALVLEGLDAEREGNVLMAQAAMVERHGWPPCRQWFKRRLSFERQRLALRRERPGAPLPDELEDADRDTRAELWKLTPPGNP